MKTAFATMIFMSFVASDARAADVDWFAGDARGITRTDSASRDAPVFAYAYGSHAHASLGMDVAIARISTSEGALRIGTYGLVTLDDAQKKSFFFPNEFWRGLAGASVAYFNDTFADRTSHAIAFEAAMTIGHESDHASDTYLYESHPPDVTSMEAPRDITYGGGGNFIGYDVALRTRFQNDVSFTLRVADRVFFDHDLVSAPSFDASLRLFSRARVEPLVSVFGEWRIPRSEDTRAAGYIRAVIGAAIEGASFKATPFIAFDDGSGPGLLINEHAFEASVGLRLAPFSRR